MHRHGTLGEVGKVMDIEGNEGAMGEEPRQSRAVPIILLVGFLVLVVAVGVLCLVEYRSLPDNVGRVLTAEEQADVIAENSSLTDYVFLSPNADFPREEPITRITVHHMAGDLSLEELGNRFANRDRRASSHYAIDSAGNVALYVEEKNRAWTSSNRDNDERAITIEVANDQVGGDWHVSDAAFEKLVELIVDICKRNGITEFTYTGDDSGTLTTHNMFNDQTICPGPYLSGRLGELANEVNSRL